jgi:hypothetical protein
VARGDVLALRGARFPETLLISVHGMRQGRQQLGMVILCSEAWSEDARDTREATGVREQIAEFFLGPVVARVISGTPRQAATRSAQATPSPAEGGWELQQVVTSARGSQPRLACSGSAG